MFPGDNDHTGSEVCEAIETDPAGSSDLVHRFDDLLC